MYIAIFIIVAIVVLVMAKREKKRNQAAAEPKPNKWEEQSSRMTDDGDLITQFNIPNPTSTDMELIRSYVEQEYHNLKLEHYLKLVKEANGPQATMDIITAQIEWNNRH